MNHLSRCKPYLGTYVEISLGAAVDDDTLIDMSNSAFDKIAYIEQLMSFHNPESELSYVNHQAYSTACEISPELHYVLAQALHLSQLTEGVFDVSIGGELVQRGLLPSVDVRVDPKASWQDIHLDDNKLTFSRPLLIDLGGIAKGYAVDQVLSLFDKSVEVSVNAGGDIGMSHWQDQRVAIRHPTRTNQVVDLPMRNSALATSASYFLNNGADIISPLDKQPIDDSYSVSVFATTCLLADALTKVFFLQPDCDALFKKLAASAIAVASTGELFSFNESR